MTTSFAVVSSLNLDWSSAKSPVRSLSVTLLQLPGLFCVKAGVMFPFFFQSVVLFFIFVFLQLKTLVTNIRVNSMSFLSNRNMHIFCLYITWLCPVPSSWMTFPQAPWDWPQVVELRSDLIMHFSVALKDMIFNLNVPSSRSFKKLIKILDCSRVVIEIAGVLGGRNIEWYLFSYKIVSILRYSPSVCSLHHPEKATKQRQNPPKTRPTGWQSGNLTRVPWYEVSTWPSQCLEWMNEICIAWVSTGVS